MTGVTRRLCLLGSIFVAAMPALASAQVVIDEIMYNPKGTDTGREWIELYNPGLADVTMIGGTGKGSWRVSDSSNHTLTDPQGGIGRGSLTIPSGGYLIITSDPAAFVSEYQDGAYSVVKSSLSLGNTGATVSLLDGSGTIVDSVTYTKDEGGYDDGSSLQKQQDGTWIAALPTSGAPNSSTAYIAPSAQTGGDATSTPQAAQAPVSSYVPPPVPLLFADAGGGRTVIVGADAKFEARAYDRDQYVLDGSNVRFSWNFGDGTIAEGETVEHHFDYPGRYAVILSIAQNKNAASDEITVTAEPAKLSFSALADGGVEIVNLAGRDLDLSGWIVRAGGGPFDAQFMLPENTKILSAASLRISATTLAFFASPQALLRYPNGEPVPLTAATASSTAPALPQQAVQAAPRRAPDPAPVVPRAITNEPMLEPALDQEPAAASEIATATATSAAQVAAVGTMGGGSLWWWVAAAALAAAASVALASAMRLGKTEWDIREM